MRSSGPKNHMAQTTVRLPHLNGALLTFGNEDFYVLLFESDSGNITLLHIVSSLERPDSGTFIYNSKDITALSDH